MPKGLIVYYSFEGTTEIVAKVLSEEFKLDCIRLKPVKELKSKGFSKFVWGGAQVVMGSIPELEPINVNLDEYDFIWLGTPIWAGTYAPPIRAFLDQPNLNNKKIAYFYTHDGGASRAEERAKEIINLRNTFVSGLGLVSVKDNLESSKNLAINWARSII